VVWLHTGSTVKYLFWNRLLFFHFSTCHSILTVSYHPLPKSTLNLTSLLQFEGVNWTDFLSLNF
jgi:hypothetical protein